MIKVFLLGEWWPEAESNCRHEDFQSTALPTELSGQVSVSKTTAVLDPRCLRQSNLIVVVRGSITLRSVDR